MVRLGIEASTPQGSVAVSEGGRLLAETILPVRAGGSEVTLPEVQRLLGACGLGVPDVEAVFVGAGPGSFTGVRIAAALAKGLCQARGLPLFAYSSLTAAAVGTGLRGPVCAAFDARRGQLYAAAYRRLDPPAADLGPAALAPDELLRLLERPADWSFVGPGAVLHAERLEAAGGRVLPAYLGVPRAAALLWMGARWPERGRVVEAADWEPQYVRRSGAERVARRAARGHGDGEARLAEVGGAEGTKHG